MKTVLAVTRFLVGVLFIFSGLVKANDPLGLSYKMQEFFEVWKWHVPAGLTLAVAVLMIAFEIIAGVAVLLGWQMKLFSWLLLLLILFFIYLTGYALFSGKIRTCGCFGDCIPLTAAQSFTKDLVLLLLILLIFMYRNTIRPAFQPALCVLLLVATALFSAGAQWYVLKFLPVADCLPFKAGSNIPQQMQVPPGAIPDSTVITFVYEKQGRQVEFSSDKFPEDFDDSLYHFVRRYDKLVRKGNAEPAVKDFVLLTGSGSDTTHALLDAEGYAAFCFTQGMEENSPAWLGDYNSIRYALKKRNIPFYFVTNDYDNVIKWNAMNRDRSDKGIVLKCDFVAIKTAARANPVLYLLKKGTVINKWSYANFDDAAKKMETLPVQAVETRTVAPVRADSSVTPVPTESINKK